MEKDPWLRHSCSEAKLFPAAVEQNARKGDTNGNEISSGNGR
jgi:hypothetical protein